MQRGPCLAASYHQEPQSPDKHFPNGLATSGDIIYRKPLLETSEEEKLAGGRAARLNCMSSEEFKKPHQIKSPW